MPGVGRGALCRSVAGRGDDEVVGSTGTHIHSPLRKATGLSPLDYVHALRLEEAKQILETEDLSIEAIAEQVGYEDTSFFGRLFRRKVGLTPAQYRLRFGSLRRALQLATKQPTHPQTMSAGAASSTAK